MSDLSVILGEWTMRRGDRLPMLSVVVETDGIPPQPVDLTGATAWLQLRCEDGSDPLTLPATFPSHELIDGWLVLQAYVYDPPNGVVVYDWPDFQTAGLTVGVDELVIRCDFPDGSHITAPSDRSARLVVRPPVLQPVLF